MSCSRDKTASEPRYKTSTTYTANQTYSETTGALPGTDNNTARTPEPNARKLGCWWRGTLVVETQLWTSGFSRFSTYKSKSRLHSCWYVIMKSHWYQSGYIIFFFRVFSQSLHPFFLVLNALFFRCADVSQKDRVHTIANNQGNRTTPSYVFSSDNGLLTGDSAKNEVSMTLYNT